MAAKSEAAILRRKQWRRQYDAARRAKQPRRPKKTKSVKALLRNRKLLPFTGCDGEGIGRGADHRYALFRIGDNELYRNGLRLTTPELLLFITLAPLDRYLVSFYFDYDVTQIIRDLPHERVKSLLRREQRAHDPRVNNPYEGSGWTWVSFDGYPEFGIDYMPKNHFRVCVGERHTVSSGDQRVGSRRTVIIANEATKRTIYDVYANFQGSFVRALAQWETGLDDLETITRMKNQRAQFTQVTGEMRRYCALECQYLAEMMEKFRAAMIEAGQPLPRSWNGAGKLASAMFKHADTIRREQVEAKLRNSALRMFHAAYYGGRFEVTRIGHVEGPVIESDQSSAYPAAMLQLPCLIHGRFRAASGHELRLVKDRLFVSQVTFTHPADQFLCGLPIRTRRGKLLWPKAGRGTYWSVELHSAERLGASIHYGPGWIYEQHCDCRPFHWMQERFLQRRRLGQRGLPIKLALAACSGKFAQRIGTAPYQNPVYGGLLTAITRAGLNDCITAMADKRNVLMLAQDAIYTLEHAPPVAFGDGIGQWKQKSFPSIFIVKPGIWWPPLAVRDVVAMKSRGLPLRFLERYTKRFEATWRVLMKRLAAGHSPDLIFPFDFPSVRLAIEIFIGVRLAYHRGQLATAGTWERDDRFISFDWTGKRGGAWQWSEGDCHIVTFPHDGDINVASVTYQPQVGLGVELSEALDLPKMDFEALQDPIELQDTNQ